jgi:hypothetical protein
MNSNDTEEIKGKLIEEEEGDLIEKLNEANISTDQLL